MLRIPLKAILASLLFGTAHLAASSADPVGPPPETKVFQIVKHNSEETPGFLALGQKRDLFVGSPFYNQVKQYSLQGTLLKTFNLPVHSDSITQGLISRWNGDVFVVVNDTSSWEKPCHGVWKISENKITKFASIPFGGTIKDLVYDKSDHLYVTDSYYGAIWKIDLQGKVELWLSHTLLQGNNIGPFEPYVPIGASGIVMGKKSRELLVANMDFGRIVKIKIHHDGSPGEVSIFVEDNRLIGVVGLSSNRRGFLYAAVPSQNAIVSISKHGKVDQIFHKSPLEQPYAIAMKRQKGINAGYLTNIATIEPEHQGVYRIKVANDPYHPDD